MSKKHFTPIIIAAMIAGMMLAGCGSADTPSSDAGQGSAASEDSAAASADSAAASAADGRRVAADGADMQTDDKSMPTRKPMEGGTKINMYFGDTVIPGVLNDCDTAKALIAKLPYTQKVSRYSHDFCGVTEELPYNENEVHYGWLNGDIDYATDAPYFTILFEDEDVSEKYGSQVNIGVITCPLDTIGSLEGDYEVRIELAE